MEYYIIILCQSNDSLGNIDFEERAVANRNMLYATYTPHTRMIIELVIYVLRVDRKRGETFSKHFSLEIHATFDCSIKTCNIMFIFFFV